MLKITKDTLRQLNAAVGCLDEDSGEIVAGFVGRLEMVDMLYHGEIRFEPGGDETPDDIVSIQEILGNTGGEEDGDTQD